MKRRILAFLLVMTAALSGCGTTGAISENSAAQEDTAADEGVVNIAAGEALYLREEPSTEADVASMLAAGQKLTILSETDEFYRVWVLSEDGVVVNEGYVKKEYVDVE